MRQVRRKVYVEVRARFDRDGGVHPLSVLWEDGMYYSVDKVLKVGPAACRKSGGQGMRYECYIDGRRTYLYLDESRWFMETDRPAGGGDLISAGV